MTKRAFERGALQNSNVTGSARGRREHDLIQDVSLKVHLDVRTEVGMDYVDICPAHSHPATFKSLEGRVKFATLIQESH